VTHHLKPADAEWLRAAPTFAPSSLADQRNVRLADASGDSVAAPGPGKPRTGNALARSLRRYTG